MTDHLNAAAADHAVAGATDYTPTSWDIAPADQAIADSILSRNPLTDIGGGSKASDSIAIKAVPYTALSPQLRAEVDKALRGVPQVSRADAEQAAIVRVLSARTAQNRVLTGLDESATEYDREQLDIARECRQLGQEWDRVTAQMTEVLRHGTDESGNPVPVYRMGPTETRHAAARLAEINYRLKLLVNDDGSDGPEAARRLAKALHGSVETQKAIDAQAEERQEAEALAEKMLRDERIEALARGLAKHRRQTL